MKKDIQDLTFLEIKRYIMRMHPGDRFELPSKDGDIPYTACMKKIGKNLVQFQKDDGSIVSLNYFEAMQANLIKPSNFESYGTDDEMDDICNALK